MIKMDLLLSMYCAGFIDLGEKYARYIVRSSLMSAWPAFLMPSSTACIRLFVLMDCFPSKRTLFAGTPFSNNSHSRWRLLKDPSALCCL
jgi:hypothetical protein